MLLPPGFLSVRADVPFTAITATGERFNVLLKPRADVFVIQTGDGRDVPIRDGLRLERTASFAYPERRPLKRVHFRDGDAIDAEFIALDESKLTLRVFGGKLISFDRTSVRSIRGVHGSQNAYFADFETAPGDRPFELKNTQVVLMEDGDHALRFGLNPLSFPIGRGGVSGSGGLRVAFRYRVLGDAPRWPTGLELTLGNERLGVPVPESQLRVAFENGTRLPVVTGEAAIRVTHQPMAAKAGWRTGTVLVQNGKFTLLLDGELRASGPVPDRETSKVQWIVDPRTDHLKSSNAEEEPAVLEIDDLIVQSRSPAFPDVRETRTDLLRRSNGDEWFGNLIRANVHRVEWGAEGETQSVGWEQIQDLWLATKEPPPMPALVGVLVRLTLAPPANHFTPRLNDARSQLLVALREVNRSTITVEHRWLGTIPIPVDAIRRVEPLGCRFQQPISVDPRHFGRATRTDFVRPEPDGVAWQTDVTLRNELTAGDADLVFEVRDVAPCGPKTPPGSPHLAELRRGGLRTDVFWDGELLGDLNSELTWSTTIQAPQRVRLKVPARLLTAGVHEIRVAQRPSQRNAELFDDCEIGPIWLEQGGSGNALP